MTCTHIFELSGLSKISHKQECQTTLQVLLNKRKMCILLFMLEKLENIEYMYMRLISRQYASTLIQSSSFS